MRYGDTYPPPLPLLEIAPQLEDALGAVLVPTFGVPVYPRPLDYLYAHVERALDAHEDAIRAHADEVTPFIFSPGLETVPDEKTDEVTPYWNNEYFTPGDARLAYAVVARYRPRRIVEVGCGNSTRFMRRAARDVGLGTRITCIDPDPREDIRLVADEVRVERLQDADPSVFEGLAANDVVFFDGSHLVLNGSDCTCFFLEVLPRLPKGIWVHVHDIFLPYDYPYRLFVDCRSNEQYMMALLVLFSREWLPALPIYYAHRKGWLPHGGGSFWMRRV